MTCDHCIASITKEVGDVDGVTSVAVDLDTKLVQVAGGDRAAVIAAIDEAGFDVAPSASRSPATAEQQLDDGVVRVTKWTFPPGTETGAHVHQFDYVVVPITDGQLTIESDGAPTVTADLVIGASYQRGKGVAHNVANDGDATVAFVEIELLDR